MSTQKNTEYINQSDKAPTGELMVVVPNDNAAEELKAFLDNEDKAKIHDISAVHSLEKAKGYTENLDEASVFERTNLKMAICRGALIGFCMAVLTSIFLSLQHEFSHVFFSSETLLMVFLFMVFGVWVSTLIGISEPNKKLKRFVGHIDRGNVLVIIKAPRRMLSYIRSLSSYALGGRLIASRATPKSQ